MAIARPSPSLRESEEEGGAQEGRVEQVTGHGDDCRHDACVEDALDNVRRRALPREPGSPEWERTGAEAGDSMTLPLRLALRLFFGLRRPEQAPDQDAQRVRLADGRGAVADGAVEDAALAVHLGPDDRHVHVAVANVRAVRAGRREAVVASTLFAGSVCR